MFYWAWWIAFAPFVGLFLARISKGRTIREFVLGAMIVPSLMCFVWFTWAGGTAIDITMQQVASGAIETGQGQRDICCAGRRQDFRHDQLHALADLPRTLVVG